MPQSRAFLGFVAMPEPAVPQSPEATAYDGFVGHLASERRLAPLSVENYARDVRDLLFLCGSMPLHAISVHDIRRFVSRLHARGLGGRSLARKLSAWRAFFTYLVRDHGYPMNPVAGVRAPRFVRPLPVTLTPDQAEQLLNVEAKAPLALRDRALFELVYSSGLRLAEVLAVSLSDIDLSERLVRVTGKGSKTRVLPVGIQAVEAIERWLEVRARLAQPQETALFVARGGGRLGPWAVRARLKALSRARGLATSVHPHTLRHSFASHMLQSSGDLRAVQELLGHASLSTTQVYTHLDYQHLAKVYDAAHPRAKRK